MPINAQCQWHLAQNTEEITADLVYDFDLETTQYMYMRHVHARDLRPEGKLHCGIVQCGGIGWSDHVAGSGAPHQMKRIRACACDSWRRMGSWTCDRGLANPRGSNGRPKTCSRWRPRTPPATRVWGYLIPLCTGGWGRGALSILTVASAMHTPQSSRALIMGCASAKNLSP